MAKLDFRQLEDIWGEVNPVGTRLPGLWITTLKTLRSWVVAHPEEELRDDVRALIYSSEPDAVVGISSDEAFIILADGEEPITIAKLPEVE